MRIARSALLAALFLLSACGSRYALTGGTMPDGTAVTFQPNDVYIVFAAATPEEAAAILSEGLRARDFTISEMSPGVIVAATTSRRLSLTIAINYNTGGGVVRYLHSEGMRVETSVSSRYYDSLTRRLTDAVIAAAARPARERADYELALARAGRPVVVSPAPVGVVVGGGGVVAGGVVAGGVVAGGGVYVGGAPASYGPGIMSCEASVERYGHSRAATIHCAGADPWCADALLRMGHNPTGLMFCRGVEPSCAVRLLESGGNPTALGRCR